MANNPNNNIQLNCAHCTGIFWRHPNDIKYKLSIGVTSYYCSRGCSARSRSDKKRENWDFWKSVEIGGENDCWPFGPRRDRSGYGLIYFLGKTVLAHRLAFKLHHKMDNWPALIMHSCDNPPCCNPKHLSEGNHYLNWADSVAKGRSKLALTANNGLGRPRNGPCSGEAARRKLPYTIVEAAILKLIQGESQTAVSKALKINIKTVWRLAHRKIYPKVWERIYEEQIRDSVAL